MEAVSLSLQLVQTTEKIYSFLKDAKNAPAELKTISNTLQSLRSVLNDAHNVLDRQHSVAGTIQGTPRPLPTISDSLQRCKEHLQPLESVVDKYSSACQHDARKRDKFWGSIRVALKKKDMVDFQNRIHQEITILNLSLGLESHNYGLHTFSAIMSEIQMLRSTTMHALSVDRLSAPGGNSTSRSMTEHNQAGEIELGPTDSPRSSRIIQRKHSLCLPAFLRQLGLQGTKISKYLAKNERPKSHSRETKTNLLCEETVYTWRPTAMSFGLQWNWGAPYGSILPALTIYPVVPQELLPSLNRDDYNINDLKADFSTGKLHPFMQSNHGFTLFHAAAMADRLDICQYLVAVGVSSRMMSTTLPAVNFALLCGCSIDTARFLFEQGFYSNDPPRIAPDSSRAIDVGVVTLGRWLWKQAPLLYDDDEVKEIRANLLCTIAESMANKRHPNLDKQLDFPGTDSTALREGLASINSLRLIFRHYAEHSCDSFETGKRWLGFLSELGVDVGDYLREETRRYTDGPLRTDSFLDDGFCCSLPRRLLIDRDASNEWSLGWEWVFDTRVPGYLVVSEFPTLANADPHISEPRWPFSRMDTLVDWWGFQGEVRRRFDYKLARKTQKKLRWSRKGMPRSRMPGSWI